MPRISKGAQARARRSNVEVGRLYPASAAKAARRSVHRIEAGRWPGNVGETVLAVVKDRIRRHIEILQRASS